MNDKKLHTLTEMVVIELEQRPETRDNDKSLVYNLYRDFYGITNEKFYTVLFDDRLPNYDSIGRARRKVQEERPDLRGSKKAEETRLEQQEMYIEFSQMTLDEIVGA